MRILRLPRKGIYAGTLILVNRAHGIVRPDEEALYPVFRPDSSILLRRRAANLLESLMEAIRGWDGIAPVSGWRSQEEQTGIWNDSLKVSGRAFTEKYVALPGHSEHQTGLAIDLGLKMDEIDFIRPAFPYEGICQTFRERAAEYGFIERYPKGKESVTGIAHEPWHFRYVGAPHAQIMAERGLTLEEYVDFLRDYPHGQRALCAVTELGETYVSYLKAQRGDGTLLELADGAPCDVSGNNIDGFIITLWRNRHADDAKTRCA